MQRQPYSCLTLSSAFCLGVECEVPAPPANTRIVPSGVQTKFFHEEITFECIDGHSIERNVFNLTVRCEAQNAWSMPLPTCNGKLL